MTHAAASGAAAIVNTRATARASVTGSRGARRRRGPARRSEHLSIAAPRGPQGDPPMRSTERGWARAPRARSTLEGHEQSPHREVLGQRGPLPRGRELAVGGRACVRQLVLDEGAELLELCRVAEPAADLAPLVPEPSCESVQLGAGGDPDRRVDALDRRLRPEACQDHKGLEGAGHVLRQGREHVAGVDRVGGDRLNP